MAYRGIGTILKAGDVAVASLTEIGGLELTADTIEVTTLDSKGGYREYIGGFKDAGEVSLSGYFNPEQGKGQKELYDLLESGEVEEFTIEFPAETGAKWQFSGVVTSFATSTGIDDPISFEAAIKVSGKPTLTIG